jgi:hypothetical protein
LSRPRATKHRTANCNACRQQAGPRLNQVLSAERGDRRADRGGRPRPPGQSAIAGHGPGALRAAVGRRIDIDGVEYSYFDQRARARLSRSGPFAQTRLDGDRLVVHRSGSPTRLTRLCHRPCTRWRSGYGGCQHFGLTRNVVMSAWWCERRGTRGQRRRYTAASRGQADRGNRRARLARRSRGRNAQPRRRGTPTGPAGSRPVERHGLDPQVETPAGRWSDQFIRAAQRAAFSRHLP